MMDTFSLGVWNTGLPQSINATCPDMASNQSRCIGHFGEQIFPVSLLNWSFYNVENDMSKINRVRRYVNVRLSSHCCSLKTHA